MTFWKLLKSYCFWHYTVALGAWWRINNNILWFLLHFFSVPLLLRTFFSPWRRLAESYPAGFSPGALAETLIVNVLMRLVGFVTRLIFLFFAVLVLAGAFLIGWLALAVWLVSPCLLSIAFLIGFYLTFLI